MAQSIDVGAIGAYFDTLTDPRRELNRKHLLADIIVIAVCGIICGCDGPTGIHRWATRQAGWLRQHLALPNGIPSRDCIRRLLLALKPQAFQQCFQRWLAEALPATADGTRPHIAIDGKTCRRSHDARHDLGALHIVSAWASAEGLALGQVATAAKSNEIAAIPLLLEQIDLSNAVVTLDAVGCQKAIAARIVAGGGDFVIAVKDNQPTLAAAVETFFQEHWDRDLDEFQYRRQETTDCGHGRREDRLYFLAPVPKGWALKKDWPEVKALGYALRLTRHADGTETSEVRYYISSRYGSGKCFAEAVRGHWSIESMHWVLDVNFREDDSRTRERTLGNNLSWLRRFAITLLKHHPSKDSLRGKMFSCAMSTAFLTEVLNLK